YELPGPAGGCVLFIEAASSNFRDARGKYFGDIWSDYAGVVSQPLGRPGLIGISSGASLFAVIMIVLEARFFSFMTAALGYYALAIAAFMGACITTFIVYRIAVRKGKADITTLLLAGIAINALA